MAQGLHDSIAQSLSFLNIQVQLLESGLKNDDKALVNDTVAQIRTGVQECYEDVRELLLNALRFRPNSRPRLSRKARNRTSPTSSSCR